MLENWKKMGATEAFITHPVCFALELLPILVWKRDVTPSLCDVLEILKFCDLVQNLIELLEESVL